MDVSNMYHSAKHLYGTRVNFGKVLEEAVAGRQLIRAIAYVIKAQGSEEDNFFDALQKQGFELKVKDLQVFWGGQKKGDWDVGLSIDAVMMADKMDTIVLVTGDGDYLPLVQYLKLNKGCFVEVIAFGESCSAKLKEIADDFIDLSVNKKKFLMPIRPTRPLRIRK